MRVLCMLFVVCVVHKHLHAQQIVYLPLSNAICLFDHRYPIEVIPPKIFITNLLLIIKVSDTAIVAETHEAICVYR